MVIIVLYHCLPDYFKADIVSHITTSVTVFIVDFASCAVSGHDLIF